MLSPRTESYELPEIDLPETLDARVPVPMQEPSPQQQSVQNEKSTTPLVEVPSPGQIVPQENVTDNSVPTVPEEPRRRSTRIRSKPKRLIVKM